MDNRYSILRWSPDDIAGWYPLGFRTYPQYQPAIVTLSWIWHKSLNDAATNFILYQGKRSSAVWSAVIASYSITGDMEQIPLQGSCLIPLEDIYLTLHKETGYVGLLAIVDGKAIPDRNT